MSEHLSLNTRLTRDYGVRYPFVSAGMGFIALPQLVAAVSKAGGIGVIGVAPENAQGMARMIREVRSHTGSIFGVDLIHETSGFGAFTTDEHVDVCAAERVPLVVFYWNPPPHRWVDTLRRAGCHVWMQTGVVDHAKQAVDAGVEALVAQGLEAGGHVKSEAPMLRNLERVRNAVPPSILVLASGGICTGRSVVDALSHGADGVWVGTSLVASIEANAHAEYKRRLVQATATDTTITTMFGPDWPDQPMRVPRNRVVCEWAGREKAIPNPPPLPAVIGHTKLTPYSAPEGVDYPMPTFAAILTTPDTTGDFEEMCLPAGEGVTMITRIRPAAEIVEEMMAAHGPSSRPTSCPQSSAACLPCRGRDISCGGHRRRRGQAAADGRDRWAGSLGTGGHRPLRRCRGIIECPGELAEY